MILKVCQYQYKYMQTGEYTLTYQVVLGLGILHHQELGGSVGVAGHDSNLLSRGVPVLQQSPLEPFVIPGLDHQLVASQHLACIVQLLNDPVHLQDVQDVVVDQNLQESLGHALPQRILCCHFPSDRLHLRVVSIIMTVVSVIQNTRLARDGNDDILFLLRLALRRPLQPGRVRKPSSRRGAHTNWPGVAV